MRIFAMLMVFVLAIGVAPAAYAALETHRSDNIDLRYEMAVGVDGRATSLRSINPLPAEVDERIQRRVRSFVFKPATRNGVPQPATTTLYLTLGEIALPNGTKGYAITSLSTGPRRLANQIYEPPKRSESGIAYFIISYDQDGRVETVELDPEADKIDQTSHPYIKWATRFAKSFRFAPEIVAGKAVASKVRMALAACGSRECPEFKAPSEGKGNHLADNMTAESVLKLQTPLPADAAI